MVPTQKQKDELAAFFKHRPKHATGKTWKVRCRSLGAALQLEENKAYDVRKLCLAFGLDPNKYKR